MIIRLIRTIFTFMIIVKPKLGTLFSLGIFVVACLSLAGYGGSIIFQNKSPEWYHYVLLLGFGPVGVGLLMRMIFKYKVVSIGKGTIEIRFPSQFKKRSYKVNNIIKWSETAIKTAGGKYKEVELLFDDKRKLNFSMQEHANYPQAINYLKKKAAKKMTK